VQRSPTSSFNRSLSLAKHPNLVNYALVSADKSIEKVPVRKTPPPRKTTTHESSTTSRDDSADVGTSTDRADKSTFIPQTATIELSKPKKQSLFDPDEVIFDRVKNYVRYFPHNNVASIIRAMNK
jgi:hypothetical protein